MIFIENKSCKTNLIACFDRITKLLAAAHSFLEISDKLSKTSRAVRSPAPVGFMSLLHYLLKF